MASTGGNPAQARELVFCHECENEWYRNEHGLTCPECHSDFVEVLEGNNDPRGNSPTEDAHLHDFHAAPDPDEEDIEHFPWQGQQQTGQHQQFHGGFPRSFSPGATPGSGNETGMPSLMGFLGGVLQTAFTPAAGHTHNDDGDRQSPDGSDQARQGSPPGQRQQMPGTFVHHQSGRNFSWTITTTSNIHAPRDAGSPQPFNQQPDNLDDILDHMLSSFGGGGPTIVRVQGGRVPGSGGGEGGPPGPFGGLAELFSGLARGQMGDAVFSQEALDRVVSQLMEQHANGNAPGPASTQAIESLPTRAITEKDLGENGKAECSICMDETPEGTTVTVLPCTHWFHHDCIKAWLLEHDTCPHCRQGIMPKEAQPGSEQQARQSGEARLHDSSSTTQPSSPTTSRDFPTAQGGFPISPITSRRRGGSSSHQTSAQTRPPAQRTGSGGGGIFSRMRDAFGGGGGSSGP